MRWNSADLNKKLAPIYLISGDDILLVNETLDSLRQFLKKNDFTEREIHQVTPGFNWLDFKANCDAYGLFSNKTLIELRNPEAKFDKVGAECIQNYCDNPASDKVVLIITEKLSGQQKQSKWYKAIEKVGAVVPIWPMNFQQLTQFIQQRLNQNGLHADNTSVKLLAELTQGNSLATDQAIQKLKLSSFTSKITPEIILETVSDSSRFSVFDWSQYLLLGQTDAALHCLSMQKQTGAEPILLLWLINKEIRVLYQYHMEQRFNHEWPARLQQLQTAARRLGLKKLTNLLSQCSDIDLSIKGLNKANTWELLEKMTMEFCCN